MRYGLFSDVHGDLEALHRAWDALQDTDLRIFLGDAVGGQRDRECVALLRQWGIPCICGNHDLDFSEVAPLPDEDRQFLAKLPEHYRGDGFLAVHSFFVSRGDYRAYQYVDDADDAEALLAAYPDRLIFIGHTHVPCLMHVRFCQRVEENTVIALQPDGRYVCNVGMTRTSVVVYDSEAHRLEFRLFERPSDRIAEARRAQPPPLISPDWKIDLGPDQRRPWWSRWFSGF